MATNFGTKIAITQLIRDRIWILALNRGFRGQAI